jgi:hypothetical protein
VNLPSFSHVQTPNLVAANETLHRDLAKANAVIREKDAENAELRATVTTLRARQRTAVRRLPDDPTAALAALTEETS